MSSERETLKVVKVEAWRLQTQEGVFVDIELGAYASGLFFSSKEEAEEAVREYEHGEHGYLIIGLPNKKWKIVNG